MTRLMAVLTSQVGRKILTGITGIGLVVFVFFHLLGNLQLFIGPEAFNKYTYNLESLGVLLYIIELGLVFMFILHAIIGINIYIRKKKARTSDYKVYNSAGHTSKQTASSRSMIITGSIILIFTVIHVATFKYGPGIREGYVTIIDGVEMRDLYSLVIDKFQSELYVIGYVLVMILLGLHLRHGVWSAFQSLGLINQAYTKLIYTAGAILAAFIAVGFLVLPVWIYFRF